jgi:hypothetical protein
MRNDHRKNFAIRIREITNQSSIREIALMRIRAIADHGFPSYPSGNPIKYLHHDQVVLKHQTSFPYGTLPAFSSQLSSM